MNHRDAMFKTKFESASLYLHARPDLVISFKFRSLPGSYGDYDLLVDALKHEPGITCSPVNGNLQGRGWLMGDGRNKIVIVGHETGLEILSVAGSIASLLGLVPLALHYWNRLRGYPRRYARGSHLTDPNNVEIRRLDANGQLIEDTLPEILGDAFTPLGIMGSMLTPAFRAIESDMRDLRDRLQTLTERVDSLENIILPVFWTSG